MSLVAYAEATSVAQRESLLFHVEAAAGGEIRGTVTVEDTVSGEPMLSAELGAGATGGTGRPGAGEWELRVPEHWPSSLYRAVFDPGGTEVFFVVRAAAPGRTSPVLVSMPFPTWEAYNHAGEPYQGLYQTDQPDRAARVSFARPGGGPPPERWEDGLLHWLGPAGYRVEYCSGLDLDDGLDLLANYRLLVINGHDEYWSKGMRDAAEEFAARGGNIAIFSGNTCWWQVRFEDDKRTMVCYRDAVRDPMASVDPRLTTVEWSSPPVNRSENSLTGVSFRQGAGCWDDTSVMSEVAYTVRFADHWVFEGTRLNDGDKFGAGCVGYETDAAEYEEIDGVPLATGRDGTPPTFVILATADLRHWRRYGQGGAATMGIFNLGAGTVFNAATIFWGNSLHDPMIDRITRNVLDRLSAGPAPERWEVIGPPDEVVALGASDGLLFAVTADGVLRSRRPGGQNLTWQRIDEAPGILALATPREAHGGPPLGLYGLTAAGTIRYRDGATGRSGWLELGPAPEGAIGLAAVDESFFAVTAAGDLWHLPMPMLGADGAQWARAGDSAGAIALTALNGLLFGLTGEDRVVVRQPFRGAAEWTDLGEAGGHRVLTGYANRLIATAPGASLCWRVATGRPA